ncbi:unnamed protein product [Prunus armeniaca]
MPSRVDPRDVDSQQWILKECKRLLEERVQPDLSIELGPRPTAPPKVPPPGGENKEHAKKPKNGNGRENGGVVKPSHEGANGGGGGHNGKHSEGGSGPSNGEPDGGVAGDEGGNSAGATEGVGERGILEKLLEKLHEIFGG